jgi:hypothetical protein
MRVDDICFGGGPTDSTYLDCSFDGARLSAGAPGAARFERCSFRNVRFDALFSEKLEFIDCVFSGKIKKGYFNGTVPVDAQAPLRRSTNEFRGNDFSAAELIDVGFRTGVDLSAQKLPQGPDYLYVPDASAALAEARKKLGTLSDSTVREQALMVIRLLELESQGGQRQLFVRTKTPLPRRLRDGAALVFSFLRSRSELRAQSGN